MAKVAQQGILGREDRGFFAENRPKRRQPVVATFELILSFYR
jgi:hypothetical protein